MANSLNKYIPTRAAAQKRRYEKKTEEIKFQKSLSHARRYVMWFADVEYMADLKQYYRDPLYKAERGSMPLSDKRIGPFRSHARKVARVAGESGQPELHQELVNLYNEYKNRRDKIGEL